MTTWGQLKRGLLRKAAVCGAAVTGTFELTARCNLRCVMCYVRKGACDDSVRSSELSAEQWLDLARQVRDAGMLYVLFTGGEVFLREDFRQIYEGTVDLGLIPTIYSNGSLITEADIEWLAKRPPEVISITLYGATPEMYGRVCGNAGAYDTVVGNIEAMLNKGLNLELSTTVNRENVGDYEALVSFSRRKGIPLKFSYYLSPVHVASQQSEIRNYRLSPDKLVLYSLRAEQEYQEQLEQLYTDFTSPQQSERATEGGRAGAIETGSAFRCSAGKTDAWLTWDGRLKLCGLSDEASEPITESGFNAGWERLKNTAEAVPACQECSDCSIREYCLSCPVRLKNETGSYDTPSSYLCEMAKLRKQLQQGHGRQGSGG